MKSPTKTPSKKPYRAPVVEKYGDIRKLTKQIGTKGMNDPGSSSGTKTG